MENHRKINAKSLKNHYTEWCFPGDVKKRYILNLSHFLMVPLVTSTFPLVNTCKGTRIWFVVWGPGSGQDSVCVRARKETFAEIKNILARCGRRLQIRVRAKKNKTFRPPPMCLPGAVFLHLPRNYKNNKESPRGSQHTEKTFGFGRTREKHAKSHDFFKNVLPSTRKKTFACFQAPGFRARADPKLTIKFACPYTKSTFPEPGNASKTL